MSKYPSIRILIHTLLFSLFWQVEVLKAMHCMAASAARWSVEYQPVQAHHVNLAIFLSLFLSA
jgi:hypothetical protein